MSDDESEYSDYSASDDDTVKAPVKKNTIMNAAKKFGNYYEDDSEPDDADVDAESSDDEEMIGGAEDKPESDSDDDADIGNNASESDDDEEEVDEDDDDDGDIEIDEEGEVIEKAQKKSSKPKKSMPLVISDEIDDDDDEYEENYLQKFDSEINRNYITEFHPECLNHNSEEIAKLTKVIRDENNIIIDPLHRTIPYLTKYEKARVLGQRSKQIETGSKPLVRVPEHIIDGYVIAELELREKKIPFIIKRPLPGGAFEYWNLKDLENINF
jgi:DNA-directed RNA polymerase I, II, and III subunit RPABC2